MSFIKNIFRTSSPDWPEETHSYPKTDAEERELLERAIEASLMQSQSPLGSCQQGGLYNLGSTCWLNGLTQAVFKHGSIYRQALESKASMHVNPRLPEDEKAVQNTFKSRANDLLEIIIASETLDDKESRLRLQKLQSTFTKAFCTIMDIPSGIQHDPSEAFHRLCDFLDLDGQLPKFQIQTNLRALSTPGNSFKGKENATTIVLASRNVNSLQEAIERQFMNPELLEENSSYDFQDGWGLQTAYKTDYLTDANVPKQILIQAPRFYERKDPGMKIGPWQIRDPQTILTKNTNPILFDERIAFPLYDQQGQRIHKIVNMKLVSIIGHTSSTLSSGHYVAYKREEDGSYTCYNDTCKSNFAPEAARERIAREGYLAVYELESLEDYQPEQARHSAFKTLPSVLPAMEHLDLDIALKAPPIMDQEPPSASSNARSAADTVKPTSATQSKAPISKICAKTLSSQLNSQEKQPPSDRLSRYQRFSNQF